MKITVHSNHKSITSPIDFELPDFTVLTGENGSGKTHLFEAISNNEISQVLVNNKPLENIVYLPFNNLNPQIAQQCDLNIISQRIKLVWKDLEQGRQRATKSKGGISEIRSIEQDFVFKQIRNPQHKEAVLRISKRSGILPSQLSEDDVADNLSMMDLFDGRLFNAQFALIFKTYHIHYLDNKLNKVYENEGTEGATPYLEDEDFKEKFGEAPWDFVNTILARLCLPYEVNNPMNTKRETTFNFLLVHKEFGFTISTKSLSTGEMTLMSLALAIYNTAGKSDRAELLILDEPDAPLHPSMSKLMLEILEEEIVKKRKIPVCISTHSLTTVACTPANSLYKISLDDKIPKRCNLEDSLRILSYGIPNLRVSTENRRQVFVEHSYDVEYYESLFCIVSRQHQFVTTPQFLPPHTLNGSNCDDVLKITRKLRDMGNTHVYGLIDWDLKNNEEQQIVILGSSNRYAIENYIFEPHILGLYLIHKKFVTPSEMGLTDCNSYLEVCELIKLDSKQIQIIVDAVEGKINWDEPQSLKAESKLADGLSLQIRVDIFKIQGHKLEDMCKTTWPKLKTVCSNNGGNSELKKDIINTVINDFPRLISKDIIETFKAFS